MLPNKPSQLGKLKVIEVYEYFDMPILYCAKNSMGNYFIVFWCDKKEVPIHKEGWLYLPISKQKLNNLRKGAISFWDAYTKPEQGYYLTYIAERSEDDEIIYVAEGDLSPELLPAEDFYVESIEPWDTSPEENWVFRLVVRNINTTVEKVAAKVSNTIQEQFTELVELTMRLFDPTNKRVFSLYDLGSDYGSVDTRLGANDVDIALKALELLKKVFDAADLDSLNKILLENKIDSHQIEDLYTSILSNKINVSIIPKFSNQEFTIQNNSVDAKLAPLRLANKPSISSTAVPQANDIDAIIKLMDLVKNGVPLVHEHFDNISSPRQVCYYKDAAYSLGLLTKNNELTPEGRFLVGRNSQHLKYQVLANLFELSECGLKWMEYYEKSTLNELDPNTAQEFILNCVSSLSESTAKRRASTLKKWLIALQPYRVEYKEDI